MKQFLWNGLFVILLITYSCSSIKPEEFNRLKSDNAGLTLENQSLKSDKTNLEAENQSLMNDLNQKKKDVAALQNMSDNLQKQLANCSNDNINLKNLVDSIKISLDKKIEELEKSIKNIQGDLTNKNIRISDLQNEISNITDTHNKMEAAMQEELASGDLKIRQIKDVLSVDFQDNIFFDSGSVDIKNSGKKTLDKVAKVLTTMTNKQIRIEGYTDNDPIAPGYKWKFPSNWELSTSRATTIVRFLQSRGIDPALLKATGYGEYNPIASNDTPEGKAQNRRIVILLVPLDERSRYR